MQNMKILKYAKRAAAHPDVQLLQPREEVVPDLDLLGSILGLQRL
jgi:hypothetical protein